MLVLDTKLRGFNMRDNNFNMHYDLELHSTNVEWLLNQTSRPTSEFIKVASALYMKTSDWDSFFKLLRNI